VRYLKKKFLKISHHFPAGGVCWHYVRRGAPIVITQSYLLKSGAIGKRSSPAAAGRVFSGQQQLVRRRRRGFQSTRHHRRGGGCDQGKSGDDDDREDNILE